MKASMDRLTTTRRVLDELKASDARKEAAERALRVMTILYGVDNAYVKARLVLAHLRRQPDSKVGNHAVYSRREAEATIRSYGVKANTPHNKSLFARMDRRIQNVETGEGTI